MTFRVVLDGPLPGPENMARDVEILEATVADGIGRARIYRWDGPWVSLGRNQRPEKALVTPEHTAWVERPTGGKAVLHGHDLCVSLAVPVPERPDLHAIYREWTAPILRACAAGGLKLSLGGQATTTQAEDCFAETGRFDLVDSGGVKRAGCAMRVTRGAALLQTSIPYTPSEFDANALIVGGVPAPDPDWRYEALPNALTASLRDAGHVVKTERGRALPASLWKAAFLWNAVDPAGVNESPDLWEWYDRQIVAHRT